MTRMNPDDWQNIDPNDPDAVGKVYTRFTHLLRHDPFTAFLTEDVQNKIAEVVLSPKCLAAEPKAASTLRMPAGPPKTAVRSAVVGVLDETPLAKLLTERFKEHIGDLAAQSVAPKDNPGQATPPETN